MAYKCPKCRNTRLLVAMWRRDPYTNLDIYAAYCRICYYLSSFEGSFNPFKGFKKHNSTSNKRVIDYTEGEISDMCLPNGIHDAILQDKK